MWWDPFPAHSKPNQVKHAPNFIVRFACHGTNKVFEEECKLSVLYDTKLNYSQLSSIGAMYRDSILDGMDLPQVSILDPWWKGT